MRRTSADHAGDDRGFATLLHGCVALVGLGLVLLLGLQLLAVGTAGIAAQHAARSAARAASLGQDGVRAGYAALPPGLAGRASITMSGSGGSVRATVAVRVPVVVPGVDVDTTQTRSADMPETAP